MFRFRHATLVALATVCLHGSRAVNGRVAGAVSGLVRQRHTRESAVVLTAHGRSCVTVLI